MEKSKIELLEAEEPKKAKIGRTKKSEPTDATVADTEAAPKKKRVLKSRKPKATSTPVVEILTATATPVPEAKIEENVQIVEENNLETEVTSALENVEEEYTGPRYSDEDLEEFRDKINEFRHEALDELRMLRERLDDYTNYDFAEESMIYSMHMAEQGPEALEQEKTYAQVQRIGEYIKKLDEALLRIKDRTYGVCRVCKCLIAKERLLAVPITTLSASYKIHKKCPEDGIDRIEPMKK